MLTSVCTFIELYLYIDIISFSPVLGIKGEDVGIVKSVAILLLCRPHLL
jgi:hypothetical protein